MGRRGGEGAEEEVEGAEGAEEEGVHLQQRVEVEEAVAEVVLQLVRLRGQGKSISSSSSRVPMPVAGCTDP